MGQTKLTAAPVGAAASVSDTVANSAADPANSLHLDELLAMRRAAASDKSHFEPWRHPDSLRPGDLRSRRQGDGLELDRIGPYQPGDDVRYIDWRASARTGRTQIRNFHAELQCTIELIVDLRSSMYFGTRHRLMAKTACLTAARLMWRLSPNAYQPVGLTCLTDSAPISLRPARGRRARLLQLQQLCDAYRHGLQALQPAMQATIYLDDALSSVARRLTRRSQAVLISDFSATGTAFAQRLREFARGHLHCVIVDDPLYLQAPPPGRYPLRAHDGASTTTVRINGNPDALQQRALELKRTLRQTLFENSAGQVLNCDTMTCNVVPFTLAQTPDAVTWQANDR